MKPSIREHTCWAPALSSLRLHAGVLKDLSSLLRPGAPGTALAALTAPLRGTPRTGPRVSPQVHSALSADHGAAGSGQLPSVLDGGEAQASQGHGGLFTHRVRGLFSRTRVAPHRASSASRVDAQPCASATGLSPVGLPLRCPHRPVWRRGQGRCSL